MSITRPKLAHASLTRTALTANRCDTLEELWPRTTPKRRREPDELAKIAIGTLIAASGPAAMAIAGHIVDTTHGKVGFIWTLAFTLLNDIGFANVYAISLALYSRVAPRQITGLVVGIYFLHLWASFSVAGWLAGFMDVWSNRDFWGVHAVLVAAGAVLLLGVRAVFGHMLSTETLAAERASAGAPELASGH